MEHCKANKYCPDSKRKDRVFAELHNILYYVQKDDPRGDKPDKPKDDPQYKNWEKGVRKYWEKEDDDIIFDEEPDECDKDDFKKYNVTVTLSVPSSVNTNSVKITADPKTEYDITKITYTVDGKTVHESRDKKYTYTIPDDKNNTTIKISVTAEDKAGNTATADAKVSVAF